MNNRTNIPSEFLNCIYCHVYGWLKTSFGMVIEFVKHLQVVITISYYTVVLYTIYNHSTLISSVCLHYFSRIYNT
jgi:hypothetical protein